MATKIQMVPVGPVAQTHIATDPAGIARRLEDGYARIDEAILRGVDIHAWEDFWLQLLEEYEEVCDGLRLEAA